MVGNYLIRCRLVFLFTKSSDRQFKKEMGFSECTVSNTCRCTRQSLEAHPILVSGRYTIRYHFGGMARVHQLLGKSVLDALKRHS